MSAYFASAALLLLTTRSLTQFNQEDFRLALHRKAENIQLEASRKLFQLSKFEAEIFLRANLFVANVINSAVPANTQSLFIQFSRASLVTTPIIFWIYSG